MRPKTIVILVVCILFFVVLVQNTDQVTLRLFFWRVQATQIIVLPIILALGFIIGYIVAKLTGKGQKGT
ncbi:MAG: lipopolysaccharide assembly protein LapA domain-containing protein [Candidatus Glassbacteria bacterium]